MKAKLGVAGLLAALVVAGVPASSSAGWGSALTCGYHTAYAPAAVAAEARAQEPGAASRDSVFKLTCASCGHGGYGSYYPAYYPSYHPSYSYYPGYSYYPSYGYSAGYSYYPSYSYSPGAGCSCGCSAWSPCGCAPACSCCSGY